MEEIGVALVNEQASKIRAIDYPVWTETKGWEVEGLVGQDEKGYDLYRLVRDDEEITVPANRLVLMQAFTERFE